jgi:predicted lipoprotein with Yx(FWY)xxD motif
MKKMTGISAGIAMLVFTLCTTQCSKKKESSLTTPSKMVSLKSNATLGNYLADKNGQTLYFFSNDANGQNNCPGGCAVTWPAYSVSNLSAGQLDAGLNLADFKSISITGGGTQLTYKGWPLYTYSPSGMPEAAGQVSGDGVGGIWFVAKPDYSVMLANWQLIGGDGNHYKSDYSLGDGNTVFFTDALGRTLYAFKKDSANHNKFTKPDFSNDPTWPTYDTATLSVPSVLDKTQFSSTNVFGKSQLTYKGWPLYRFGADSSVRANTKGITFGGIGTVWPVMVMSIAPAPHP